MYVYMYLCIYMLKYSCVNDIKYLEGNAKWLTLAGGIFVVCKFFYYLHILYDICIYSFNKSNTC